MTTPNAALAYQVLDHIDAHPETWIQKTWWCGTGGCFAGWTAELSGEHPGPGGRLPGGVHVGERAAQLLGFASESELLAAGLAAIYPDGEPDEDDETGPEYELFSAINTREDLGRLVAEIFGPRPDAAS